MGQYGIGKGEHGRAIGYIEDVAADLSVLLAQGAGDAFQVGGINVGQRQVAAFLGQ
jgi:hypothetical protein